MGDHERMMIGEARDPGAQFDPARALGSSGHKHFRGADGLPAGAVVFTDIGLIKTQHIEPLDNLQVAFQGQGRVFTWPVEGSHEDAELHSRWYDHNALLLSSRRQLSHQYHLRSDVVLLELITQLAGRNAQQGGGAGLYTAAAAQGLEEAFALDVSHSLRQGGGRGLGKEHPGWRRGYMDIDGKWHILGRYNLPTRHDHHALNAVLQLADIARPIIAHDQVHSG